MTERMQGSASGSGITENTAEMKAGTMAATTAAAAPEKAPGTVEERTMGRAVRTMYLAMLVLLIILPTVIFLPLRSRLAADSHENRELAEMPVLTAATISTFPQDFDAYWNDHLPFKSQLVVTNGFIDYEIFGSSGSPYVIVGKDGWLFYKGQQANYEDPEGDYAGTNLFTDEELELIRANMLRARDQLAERGTQFIIFIAPNKERVYAEYMPDAYGEPAPENRMRQVVDYLRSTTDLTVICPYDELMAYKAAHPEEQIYYKYDTHWNNLGAYIGTKVLDEYLGYMMPEPENAGMEIAGGGYYDLATLLGLREILRDDRVYVLKNYTQRELTEERDDNATEFRYHNIGNEATAKKVFIVGDSFSTMMGKYVACNYNDLYVNSYLRYDKWILQYEDPDILIYETVERYLGNMLDFDLEEGIGKNRR